MTDKTLEADILELMRVRRLVRQLEVPAYLFERYGRPSCEGDCNFPVYICETFPEALTCCHLQPVYQQYHDARRLEDALRRKVDAHRNFRESVAA